MRAAPKLAPFAARRFFCWSRDADALASSATGGDDDRTPCIAERVRAQLLARVAALGRGEPPPPPPAIPSLFVGGDDGAREVSSDVVTMSLAELTAAARAALTGQRMVEAERLLRAALERGGGDDAGETQDAAAARRHRARLHAMLGQTLHALARPAEASLAFAAAVEGADREAQWPIRANWGMALAAFGDTKGAERQLEAAIAAAPPEHVPGLVRIRDEL
jgi:hypothetical protein